MSSSFIVTEHGTYIASCFLPLAGLQCGFGESDEQKLVRTT